MSHSSSHGVADSITVIGAEFEIKEQSSDSVSSIMRYALVKSMIPWITEQNAFSCLEITISVGEGKHLDKSILEDKWATSR